ncbi:MAG: glycosyltransferase [Anaerolineae bacterium]|nr:glycosyltransferase [Anaerolineae bacterium]
MTDPSAKQTDDGSIVVLIPVFNDWEALRLLIGELDATLAENKREIEILLVDDGSTSNPDGFCCNERNYLAVRTIDILELSRNLGHQRAIAVGLAYVQQRMRCKAVVIMDADGEDNPEDVPRLIGMFDSQRETRVIFARRVKRSESAMFKLFYGLYKAIYFLLTGAKVRFGNFSVVPYDLLPKLVVVSEIWNHYAAGVMKARIPYVEIPTKRGKRLSGRSRMNFVSLVIHGLGAVSVHSDVIGVRALVAMLSFAFVSITGILVVVVLRVFTDLAIPGWASFVTLSFMVLLMQAVMMALLFVFIILNNRSSLAFIPRRDYEYFVLSIKRVYSHK